MSYRFDNQVIVITGAASGIGRATAKKLASLGATLALSDINNDGLQQTNELCGGKHFIEVVDVGSPMAARSHIDLVFEEYGRLDHVFNCAGVNPTAQPLEATTEAYWDKLMNTNLKGIFNITKPAIHYLERRSGSGGSLVNVSSVLGLHPSAQNAIYCATKYGVIGFSKSMALELGSRGMRVNVVAPGYIDTPTNSSVVAGMESIKEAEKKIAAGRMGTAEEVADVVAFLMSDESRYMNGSVVEVNGGTG